MASDLVTSPIQTISLFSNGRSPHQLRKEFSPASLFPKGDGLEKKDTQSAGDTVSLSPQLQQALDDAEKKDKMKLYEEPEKKKEISNSAVAKVEIAYDSNGELVTKYLDTANRLVYQSPSEMALFLRETEAKSKATVNTTA